MPEEKDSTLKNQNAEDSSATATEKDVKDTTDSSTDTQAEEQTMDTESDRLVQEAETADASVKNEDETSTTDGDDETDEVKKPADDAGETEETDTEEDDEEKDKTDESLTDPAKPPPFNEHPAWKRVLKERDEYKPLAERQQALEQFCNSNRISGPEFQNMLEIGALMQRDPQKAYERLAPIVDGLAQFLGHKISVDLETQVATGKLTPEQAKQMAKLEAQAKVNNFQREQQEREYQQQMAQFTQRAVTDWTAQKQKTDLAFKPKVNGLPDGLWELVDDRYARLHAASPPRTPQDAVALAERAYNEIKAVYSPLKKVVVHSTRRLSSDRSSSRTIKEPKSLDEAAMAATGYTWETRKQR